MVYVIFAPWNENLPIAVAPNKNLAQKKAHTINPPYAYCTIDEYQKVKDVPPLKVYACMRLAEKLSDCILTV